MHIIKNVLKQARTTVKRDERSIRSQKSKTTGQFHWKKITKKKTSLNIKRYLQIKKLSHRHIHGETLMIPTDSN